MNNMEEWKDISGYEGIYQVSSFGRVRSVDRIVNGPKTKKKIKGRMIVLRNHGSGYKTVNLWKDNNFHIAYVHRIVAEAFIPIQEGKHEVNHIDNCKSNNNVDNLEWCTHQENGFHAHRGGFNRSSKKVVMLDGNNLVEFYSMTEAERETGIPHQEISRKCRNGKAVIKGKTFYVSKEIA